MKAQLVAPPAPRFSLPSPPDLMLQDVEIPLFERSVEMEEFLRAHWIDEGGVFPTEPHAHLQEARVGVLWTNVPSPISNGGGRAVVGLAEIFEPRPAKRWIMERQRWAMHQLFGWDLPDFVISLDAPHFANDFVSVASKLGTLTHELCHCGQAHDADGNPRIVRSGPLKGQPVWCIVPHEVEQFNLVVEYFGAEAAHVLPMVRAAAAGATMRDRLREYFGVEIGEAEPFTCGTCKAA